MNVNPFSYLIDKISTKVSKSGDTMSGRLVINRQSSNTSVSWSEIEFGNDVAEGTVGNSAGRLVLLGKGTKYTILDAPNSTANRTIDFPDKSGTVALTSDIPTISSVSVPVAGTVLSSYYASVNIPLDYSKYIVIGILESGSWNENVTYSLYDSNTKYVLNIKSLRSASYTLPSNASPVKVLYTTK